MSTESSPETHAPMAGRELINTRAVVSRMCGGALGVCGATGLAMMMLVLRTDPTPWNERVFVALLACSCSALIMAGSLHLACALDGWLGIVRVIRRSCLAGIACTGVAVLQLMAGLTVANLAFVCLLLLIVEMFFVAGQPRYRQAQRSAMNQGSSNDDESREHQIRSLNGPQLQAEDGR